MLFYDGYSKTVMQNRFRMSRGDIFAIRDNKYLFYDTNSKTVFLSRLRMYECGNSIINMNVNDDSFV